mgnify:CR=1 FL=1|tara:strand:+ start:130 stop:333 length:204 start_codon:yes stop_codon:yes gene_type:complete
MHSVEQLYTKIQAIHQKGIELHRERFKKTGTYDNQTCQFLIDDIKALAREVSNTTVDLDVDFGKPKV